MAERNSSQSTHMNTSKQINTVFGCQGENYHLTPGFRLLRSSDPSRCPVCGASVFDASDTPVGKEYLKQAGFRREDARS
jgi:hypothetical protein